MSEKEPWYSNKELFELINDLRFEMKETRTTIKKYNGLREELGETQKELREVKEDVSEIKAITKGKSKVGEAIRLWGGWIFALIPFLILLSQIL